MTIRNCPAWAAALLLSMALLATSSPATAQMQMHADAEEFAFYPDDPGYDPEVPTLEQVVGHSWGERITAPDEAMRYMQELAAASGKVSMREYARSWEGRPLVYVIVASEENQARIQDIRDRNLALTDPRVTDRDAAEAIIADNPVITWLAYGVHGNEISSTDAALLTMYHLAAATTDPLTDVVLANSVVVIDPMQNPDGRNRFSNHYRQAKGMWADAHTSSVELNEPWPGGRTNHYLFDLNRDWFALTQPETQGKVAAFMHWRPQIYVDLHEMGANSTYYFPPQAVPYNPNIAAEILDWTAKIGENNARWFDRMGFSYFNREVFDAFYPGYGSSWPTYQGAMGLTYEQASSRGLRQQRNDETVLEYRDTVHGHYIASLSTAELAANNREGILRDFYGFGVNAIEEGRSDEFREIILPPGKDPARVDRLIDLVMKQGVEVARASEPFGNVVEDYHGGEPVDREFPAGTYRITLAQPNKAFVKGLLGPDVPMDEEFLREQRRRYLRREGDQIYDITGWSLPLLFDLEAYTASEPSTSASVLAADTLAAPPTAAGAVHGEPATVAYLVPWGLQASVEGLAALHHHKIRVHSAGDSFTIGGREYPAGSLIIRVAENGDDLHEQLQMIADHHGVDFYPTNTSWVEDGISFGSNRVRYLKQPKIALAWDRPTGAYSAGWARYLIEVAYHYPVTIIRTEQLARTDMSDFDVLILPDGGFFGGGYGGVLRERAVDGLRDWIQGGGTLVTMGASTRWLTDENVALLSTSRKVKKTPEDADPTQTVDGVATGLPDGVLPDEQQPSGLPGPILRAQLDPEHWLAFGYGDAINLIAQSRNVYEPITIDNGINVATYRPLDELLVTGVAWDDELALIAGTPYLMYESLGRGHIVAFAEDPNFRAYFDGLNGLFMNAVFLGPGY
jgi:hypothetical protein